MPNVNDIGKSGLIVRFFYWLCFFFDIVGLYNLLEKNLDEDTIVYYLLLFGFFYKNKSVINT